MSLEVVVALILAASAKSERSELRSLVRFMTVVVVSHISSTAEDLDELVYKSVDLERACEDVFGADAKQLA